MERGLTALCLEDDQEGEDCFLVVVVTVSERSLDFWGAVVWVNISSNPVY